MRTLRVFSLPVKSKMSPQASAAVIECFKKEKSTGIIDIQNIRLEKGGTLNANFPLFSYSNT